MHAPEWSSRNRLLGACGGLLLACSFGAVAQEPALVEVNERIEYYTVDGADWDSLREQIDSRRPLARDGRPSHGLTAIEIESRYQLHPGPQGCTLTHLEISLEITTRMPRWQPATEVEAVLMQRWEATALALAEHEAGHSDIAQRAANRLGQALLQLQPADDCTTLRRVADAVRMRSWHWLDMQSMAFDQRTRHGAAAGPVLPKSSAEADPACLPPSVRARRGCSAVASPTCGC